MTATEAPTPTAAQLGNARRTLQRKYRDHGLVTDAAVHCLAQEIARLEALGITGLGVPVSR